MNIVSQEENVRSALAKVALGEADAAFVYRTDVHTAVASSLHVIEIPASANVAAAYGIAVIRGSGSVGMTFVDYVSGDSAVNVLDRFGFTPVTRSTER